MIQGDQGLSHSVDEALGVFEGFIRGLLDHYQFFAGFFQTIFYLLPLGDVLDGQKNDPFFSRPPLNLPGIQKHDALANGGKIVLNFIVVEGCLLGQDGFQQFPQFGDVPLLIAQVIDQLSYRLFRIYLKDFIERTADGDYP